MLRRALVAALALVIVSLPPVATAGATTVTFDDLTNPNRTLNGQYPTGIIDWGSNTWYLSGPWGQFTTNSVSFNSASITSGGFTFTNPQRLVQIEAFNGGTGSSTVTLACAGQTTRSQSVNANQRLTIATSWLGTCTAVTITSSNSWWTNFDNLVVDNGLGPVISAVQPAAVGPDTATITWNTDVGATSQVDYGRSSTYGSSTALDSTLLTSHSVVLSGLPSATQFHFRVRSSDSAGNQSVSGDFAFMTTSTFCDPPITNPVACENTRAGTPSSQWDIPSRDMGDGTIQGFATDISYVPGGTVNFKINTPANAYTITVYRVGYYQGNGARQIATVAPSVTLPQSQPACLSDTATGLIDCGSWAVSASWTIPANAVSGVYFARLQRSDSGGVSHILFVVRDDVGNAPVLFQTSDTTWQAYNAFGGNSLYWGGPATNPNRAYKVSYNRPFTSRNQGTGGGPTNFFWDAEYPMVRWLEANGYNVTYASGVDTERRGAAALQQHRVFVSTGHDEYWSGGMRGNVETALGAGVNLAFFSGNNVFWKTRWENSIDGSNTAYRTMVSYKETHAGRVIDPADPPTWTGTWRDRRFSPPADGGRPENGLTGNIFMVNATRTDTISVTSAFSRLRFWRNTPVASLAAGGSVAVAPGSLGFEWGSDLDNGFRPAGLIDLSSTTISVNSMLLDNGSTYGPGTARHSLTLYRHPSGALVFGAGYTRYSWGLDSNHDVSSNPADPIVQQITVNLLADMGVQPAALQGGVVAASASTDTTRPVSTIVSPLAGTVLSAGSAATVSGTAVDVGGVVGGVEVSVDGGASWHPATGGANWSYNWTTGSSGSITIRSRAVDDSGNLEISSPGVTVSIGPGATSTPTPTATATPLPGTSTPTPTPGTPTPTSVPGSCPCTLFASSATPIAARGTDPNSVEVGVKFRADSAGVVTGLRFYKMAVNISSHVGSLWSSTGALLASATFTNESVSGWQQVTFNSPIPIAANTTYIASYHTEGHYAADQTYFSGHSVDAAPLHALANGVDGGNGVYMYGPSTAFPSNTYNSSNYWVDVVFK
jgi:hypothetical protein